MLTVDFTVFFSIHGLLKIATLVLGIIGIGLTADSYMHHIGHAMETFYLAIVIIMFIASVIFLLLFILKIITDSDMTKKMDLLFHLVAGLFLICSASLWFVSVDKHYVMMADGVYRYDPVDRINFNKHLSKDADKEQMIEEVQSLHYERISAGVVGVLNGMIYLAISVFIFIRA